VTHRGGTAPPRRASPSHLCSPETPGPRSPHRTLPAQTSPPSGCLRTLPRQSIPQWAPPIYLAEKFQLSVDVAGFSPEELTVRMEGRSVTVTGKHANQSMWEEGGCRQEYRELRTQAVQPEDVDLQAVTCCLSRDGQLCIQAPRLAPPPVEERALPISI
uniref:SHSP domain-containing protein n=1 Tax=Chelonoidis abingdonii TaxID=106734 RepID=A0A8C0HAB1_CHEAB